MSKTRTSNKIAISILILLLTLSILSVRYIVPVVEASPDIYWIEAGAVGNGTLEATPAGNITYVLGVVADNDVIEVKPGIYNTTIGESFPLIIDDDNVTIQSTDGSAVTIIDAGANPGIIHVKKANATIGGIDAGFTILNNWTSAPDVTGYDIDYGVLVGATTGVAGATQGAKIQGNAFQVKGNGITLCSEANSTETNKAQILDNTFEVGWDAVRTADLPGGNLVQNVDLLRNNVTATGLVTWGDMGFVLESAANVTVSNNTFTDCDAALYLTANYANAIGMVTASDFTITNNTFTNCPRGILVWPGSNVIGGPCTISDVEISENTLEGGDKGVWVRIDTGVTDGNISNIDIYYNNIYSHTEYGVLNNFTVVVNATLNWWGNASGPYHPVLNGGGTGDNVSDYVSFDPWLLQPFPPANVSISSVLYADPPVIECWTPSYGRNFTIEVKIDNVTGLFGYEFKLYWNTTLLDLTGVQITPPWSNYLIAKNETNETLGRYWLAVGAYDVPTFNGNTTLARLPFQITYDPIYPENKTCKLDLADTKLTAPLGVPIYHTVQDGDYHMYSTKPKIEVKPSIYTAHALGEIFNIDINVSDVVNLYGFNLTLTYNTTLVDVTSVVIGPFLNTPVSSSSTINNTAGFAWVMASSQNPAAPANGSGTLATITLEVIYGTIWPEPQLTCSLALHQTTLAIKNGAEVEHDVTDSTYVYAPKPGDLDMDGKVNLVDLRIVAYYYDPNYDIIADLNRDTFVDIFDLSIVASYYGEDP